MAGCAKCGSQVLVDDVRIADRNESFDTDLSVRVERNPQALIFTEELYAPFRATMCASCGYTELYVIHPKAVVEAVQKAQNVLGKGARNPGAPWYWECPTCRRWNSPSSTSCMGCSAPRQGAS